MKSRRPRKQAPPKRPITFNYIVFYLLFSPDTYRVAIGLIAATLIAPYIIPADLDSAAKIMVFIMIATIGYAISTIPGRNIARYFQKRILKK